jgi:hypothetical protein
VSGLITDRQAQHAPHLHGQDARKQRRVTKP